VSYTVGQSKVRHWRSCRQAYDFKYEQQLIRRRTKRPFVFGRLVHRMIEAEAQEEDPLAVLDQIELDDLEIFTAEKDMYGEIIEDIRTIMREYFEYHADGLRFIPVEDETGELRFAEHEFAIPLEDLVDRRKVPPRDVEGIVFKGQVDGIGKTPNKLRWLVENKTFDNLPNDDERWRNLQSVVYIRAILYLGWMKRIDGVCWNYIRSKPPTVPKVLKSGRLSMKKKIVTLPSVVRAAVAAAKLRIQDYDELMKRAVQTRADYFQRIYTPVNETISSKIFGGFVESAIEMRDSAGKKRDKNIGRHCTWCDYEPLCRAELTGGDVDFVREGEYKVEDPEGYHRTKRRSPQLKVVRGGKK